RSVAASYRSSGTPAASRAAAQYLIVTWVTPISSLIEYRGGVMGAVLLLTNAAGPSAEVLPALALLPHTVRVVSAEASALVDTPQADVVLLDARRELVRARALAR